MSTGEGKIVKLNLLRRFRADNQGATAIEYGLIVALIFLAILSSIGAFGGKSIDMWNDVSAKQSAAVGGAP